MALNKSKSENNICKCLKKSVYSYDENIQIEKFLEELLANISDADDIGTTLQVVADILGEFLEADRSYIAVFKNKEKLEISKEYRKNKDVESVLGFDLFSQEASFIKKIMQKKEIIFAEDVLNLPNKFDIALVSHEFMKKKNINAFILVPIFYKQSFMGVITFHSSKPFWSWQKEKEVLLKILSDYLGIIISQGLMNNEVNKNIAREKLCRLISEKIIHSLDLDEVLDAVCNEISDIFNAERVILVNCNNREDYSNWDYKKINENQQDNFLNNLDSSEKELIAHFWVKTLKENNGLYYTGDIENSILPDILKDFYKKTGLLSLAGLALSDDKVEWGSLLIARKKSQNWTEDELELLKGISSYVFIALKHSQMHTELKKQIQKENLLRTEKSIIINENLAKNLGLSTSITYSALANNYNNLRDENRIDEKQNAYISFDKLMSQTFLDNFEQKKSLHKLIERGLIDCKSVNGDKIVYKIIEDENYMKSLMTDPVFKKIKQKLVEADVKETRSFSLKELNELYMQFFSENTISAVNYFFEKTYLNLHRKNKTITKGYYAVICRTLDDFMENHDLSLKSTIHILDNLFSENKCSSREIESIENSTQANVGKLKKILFYRLHESRLLATDFVSKIDLYSTPELLFSDNVKFLNEVLPKDG